MQIQQNIKIATDAVVFGYTNNRLQILLIQHKFGKVKDQWALPGGFVLDNESLDECVVRELREETGVTASYMEQLQSFGSIGRDPRKRVVSVAYLALVNPSHYNLKATTDVKDAKWYDISEIPSLAFDHKEILEVGLNRLRTKILYKPIGFDLLASEFPFSDIENLYQTILSRTIDRRNFRKKLLKYGFVEETDKIFKPKTGRPAKLFRFNTAKYKELQTNGFYFDIKFA